MKRLLTLLIFAISLQTYAQLPDAFNYQATIRAESGDLLVNTNVNFKVTIYEGQGVGDTYVESHFVPTDDLGHVNFVVGYGQPLEGSMAEIDWSMGNYFMKVELDTGQGYVDMGDTQLLSVPYALYALESGGETGDLQSVLNAGPDANLNLTENNNSGIELTFNVQDQTDQIYNGFNSTIISSNGETYAIRGESFGESQNRHHGVEGRASGGAQLNVGVHGMTGGDAGQNVAVWGEARSSQSRNTALMGYATFPTPGSNYGVFGLAGGSESLNVAVNAAIENHGSDNNSQNGDSYGIFSSSTVPSNSTNYGIYSVAYGGSSNFAGYFSGDVYVDQSGYLKAENQPVEDNDVVNKAYLESVLQAYDDRLSVLEEVVESLQESGSLLVDQDGNILLTQQYGEDTWTTENAKVVTYRDGTPIPYVATMTEAFDASIGHWTYANGDPSSGKILYNYKAVQGIWDADSAGDPSQRKELAPEGWHVPTHTEWNNFHNLMINTYGTEYAKAVSSQSGWNDSGMENTPGTLPEENNQSGFNLYPDGYFWVNDPNPQNYGSLSVLWTSEYELDSSAAGYYYVYAEGSAPYLSSLGQGEVLPGDQYFFSVRFVQGEGNSNNVSGYCGDGIVSVELGEQCDDGNDNPNDGCDGCMIVEDDLDGDGYSVAQGDCDDNNIYVNPGAVEVCDQVDNNCDGAVDELDADTFTGQYVMTFSGGGLPELSNVGVFGTDQLVTLVISGLNSRSFTSPTVYPDYGGWPGVAVDLSFNCGNIFLSNNADLGVGCGNGNVILGPEGGQYNELDDSSFTLIMTEDINSSCGTPAPTFYTFTKVN